MAWFLRALETENGSWSCRRGSEVLDQHPTIHEALDHLHQLAEEYRPSVVFAHWLDGRIERMREVDPET